MKTRMTIIMLGAILIFVGIAGAQQVQVLMPGKTIPKYVDPLPLLQFESGVLDGRRCHISHHHRKRGGRCSSPPFQKMVRSTFGADHPVRGSLEIHLARTSADWVIAIELILKALSS